MTTALVAARERLDDATQNLANVQSGGFQRRIAHVGLGPGGLTVIHERDSSHGPLERTGRALDLATAGEGGFFVRDPSGAALLVRSASLTANADGTLADERGRAVLGENGPVRASSNATVDAAGVLHDGARAVRLRTAEGTTLRDGL
ncbi:MAG: hypothetical protein GIW95_01320, partial [Candidatus Eremiobacteraeota bacterium]|nr:hypothetical protein [Candidatus Eremiobacteraeota bacterium]